ncbi:adhesion G protein-coupled receptor E2-like [Amphiura filiformis]|uniref:adhesion G protein-coupled receptor E2-like n=1 Tax=Amphiura filiformis TaxID=82378 RepID=UPI003B21175F
MPATRWAYMIRCTMYEVNDLAWMIARYCNRGNSSTNINLPGVEFEVPGLSDSSTHEFAETTQEPEGLVQYKYAVILVTPDTSCQGRCGYQPGFATCRCDPQCDIFQDCCYDFHDICLSTSVKTGMFDPALFTCAPLDRDYPNFAFVMLVGRCPANWHNEFIAHRCEHLPTIYENAADRLQLEWPVSDQNGDNFQNLFCALCNGKDLNDIQPWDVKYPDSTFSRVNQESSGICGSQYELGSVGKRLRSCFPSLIAPCPSLSNVNESIVTLCEAYSNHVCTSHGESYKNHHCALCNGVDDVNSLYPCPGIAGRNSAVLQRIWKFKENSPTSHEHVQRCADTDTTYDPYTQECRSLSCSPGYILNNKSECIVAVSGTSAVTEGLCCQRQLTWIFFEHDKPSERSADLVDDENILCFLQYLNISGNTSNWKRNRNLGSYSDKYLLQSNSTCNIVGVLDEIFQGSELFSVCNNIHKHVVYTFMCSHFPSNGTCEKSWFSGNASQFILVNVTHVAAAFLHNGQYLLPEFTLHQVIYKYDVLRSEIMKEEIVQVCGEIVHPLRCTLITLTADDYTVTWTENQSRAIQFGNISFEQGEYMMYPDGRVQICADHLTKHKVNEFFAYSGQLALANTIGTGLSLCGLTITFALHCCFSSLRNFHGRCVMILCVLLFFAQLLPTLSAYNSFPSWLCVISGLLSHYSWLGSFSWMTVIAFTLFHIFKPGAMRRNNDWESEPVCRYVAPTFGFGVPLVVVVITLCFHFIHSSLVYGANSPCWISDSVSNFWAFGLPVGIFLAFNTGLFSVTVGLACRNQRRSRQLQQRQETIRTFFRDLLLCFKIQLLMGITWTIGFFASFLDNETLWWVFIITNSLHGVMLLLVTLSGSKFTGRTRQVQQVR